jgi:hypothetical protein
MMKKRTLLSGEEVLELEQSKILTVKTKCPEKWKLTDMETGEVYIGYSTEGQLSWKKINILSRSLRRSI